ncbi:hypothetical protein BGX33_000818, partial [Mortierella sp. NVP41]
NEPQRTNGVIDLEGFDQVVTLEVCWEHQMLMNLVPWTEREAARTTDLDLFVCGWKRNTRWTDNVVFDGNHCAVTVEVYFVITLAPAPAPASPNFPLPSAFVAPSPYFYPAAPASLFLPASPYIPPPPMVCHQQQQVCYHDYRDSDIKVEIDINRNDCWNTNIKVEVDVNYQNKPMHEKQEAVHSQSPQYIPPPPAMEDEKQEIKSQRYMFPHLPSHATDETESVTSKTSRHKDLFRRFHVHIRSRS